MRTSSVLTLRKVIWLVLLFLTISTYGFLFPQKYYFNCEETSFRSNSKVTYYDLKTNNKIDAEYRSWVSEDVMVKKFYWGLFYTLDYYDISECGIAFDNTIVCSRASASKLNPKVDDYTDFDLINATLNKTWFSVDHKKQIITEYDSSNLACKKIIPALD